MIVYHYTYEEAYDQIMATKEFLPSFLSTALDSVYGEGWYFTDLPPSRSNDELYRHIWRQRQPERIRRYLVFDIDRVLLQNKRLHVYKLSLESIRDALIELDLKYTSQGKTVIRFIRGGFRR